MNDYEYETKYDPFCKVVEHNKLEECPYNLEHTLSGGKKDFSIMRYIQLRIVIYLNRMMDYLLDTYVKLSEMKWL